MRTGEQETSPGPSPGGTLCWGPPGATIFAPVLPPRADMFPPGTANPQGWGWVRLRGARVKVRVWVGVRVRVRVSNGVTTGCRSTISHPIRCPTPTVPPRHCPFASAMGTCDVPKPPPWYSGPLPPAAPWQGTVQIPPNTPPGPKCPRLGMVALTWPGAVVTGRVGVRWPPTRGWPGPLPQPAGTAQRSRRKWREGQSHSQEVWTRR